MEDVDTQTIGILYNLAIGFVTIVVCLFLFDIFRRRFPTIFEARRTLQDRSEPLDYHSNKIYSPAPPSRRPLGWLRPLLHIDLHSVAETHGLDTALFLRFLRTNAIAFVLLLLPTLPLLLVFYTGENKNSEAGDLQTFGIQRFSISNVARDDPWRFWVVLVADYAVVALVYVLIYREFCMYAMYRRRYRSSTNPSNYAILVKDIPRGSCTEKIVNNYWERLFPGQLSKVLVVRDARKLVAKKGKYWTAITHRERAEWDFRYNKKLDGERPRHCNGFCSCLGCTKSVDSIDYWAGQQNELLKMVSAEQNEARSKSSPVVGAAIVVFQSRRAASTAAQTNFAVQANEWRVVRAPEPFAVNWNALRIPNYQAAVRASTTIVLSVLLILFWVIPVTAIMSLVNLTKLAEITINGDQPFNFLLKVQDWSPAIVGLIESLLPSIILSVFLGLVPTILRLFVSISRVSSHAQMDKLVRDWYFGFVIFSNFFFVIVAGSLLNELKKIIDDYQQAPKLLASAAPGQGAFMMNFILLKALSETPQELLQIGRVVVRWFMLKFSAKTRRQRMKVDTGEMTYQFHRYYGIAQLVALLGIVYSTISPFIIPCCIAYFVLMYVVHKYNLCYSLYNTYQDGGSMYSGALYGMWTGVFLHIVTMIGIFGLNGNPAQSFLVLLPAFVSVPYLFFLRRSFERISEHGSALESLLKCEENDEGDLTPEETSNLYVHPGLVPLPESVKNLNGVDETEEDKFDEEYGKGADSGGRAVVMEAGETEGDNRGLDRGGTEEEGWVDAYDGASNG